MLCLERLKAIDHSDWKTIQNYRFSLLCLFIAIIIITVTPLQLASGQLCISNDPDDIDGDGISNKWEVEGIDINGDNKIDLNLAALGASPVHKDLFLEVDYMKYHKPYSSVIPDVISEFEVAPVCNPDGSKGIMRDTVARPKGEPQT